MSATHPKCCPGQKLRLVAATPKEPDFVECEQCAFIEPLAAWSAHVPIAPLNSTNVDGSGYHAGLRVLRINFKSGGRYAFLDVPQEIADALAADEHPGSFFARTIKGKFPGIKLPEPESTP